MQMIDRLKDFSPSSLQKHIFYYMAKGNESGKGWKESISEAKSFFERANTQKNMHFAYEFFPKLDHTTVIPTAVINGFNAWFNYQYWDIDNLKAYHTRLQSEAGYQFSEQDITGFAYHRFWAKDTKNMKAILDWGLAIYPESKSLQSLSKRQNASADTKDAAVKIFPEKCLGVWEGTMYMYRFDTVRDSVKVRFTAARTAIDSIYTWKTEYLSATRPAVKDYKLVVDTTNSGRYILDEGNDVKLIDTHIGKKLMSVFQVDDILLTSSYEFIGDTLVFEVASGKAQEQTSTTTESISKEENAEMTLKNFIFSNIQRVVLHRVE